MENKNKIVKYGIYVVLIIGLLVCVAVLFPQTRQLIIRMMEQIKHDKILSVLEWNNALVSYAEGGILLIITLSYCFLTTRGKLLVRQLKNGIKDCLTEIDWHSFIRPVLIMSGIYLLGVISIIRANFLYYDDLKRTLHGEREWYDWSRYVSEISSIFIHADFHLTDISPVPQLLAVFMLAVSSVLFVYVLNHKKITIIGLLASIPVGLSPYMLGSLSYKYDAPYMALSVLASIVPFLFLARKNAFMFCSVISLLIMCMTYQAASGIYLLVTLILGFNDWNRKWKTNREVFLFLGRAVFSFGLAMIIFRLFLMKPHSSYVSNAMFPLPQMLPGILANFQTYMNTINSDFGFIWKAIIGIIFCFFIAKSVHTSAQNKMISFLTAIILLCLLFVLSYGVYLALEHPLFAQRALYGFGVFLAIVSIYIVSEFNAIAKITALALSWSFFVFAFSYGNALADQMRYTNFRASILLQDLSALYPDKDENKMTILLKNTIGFAPSIRNIAKHNPVIFRLVPQILMGDDPWTNYYLLYFNYSPFTTSDLTMIMKNDKPSADFDTSDLPIVLKTYYHTIKSDGKWVLVELSEGSDVLKHK